MRPPDHENRGERPSATRKSDLATNDVVDQSDAGSSDVGW
jgi:hypothetical protein